MLQNHAEILSKINLWPDVSDTLPNTEYLKFTKNKHLICTLYNVHLKYCKMEQL